jgi:uncharacterized repeat protein (TIGR02543 family)
MPAEDITLYAKWNIHHYDIQYELNGGTNHSNNPFSYTIRSETITLGHPIREGYTFVGWYDNPEGDGYPISEIVSGTIETIILYAKWHINEYTVTYQVKTEGFDPQSHIPLLPNETIVHTSRGGIHASALTSSGRLFMWGYNYYGQLGNSTTTRQLVPRDITSYFPLQSGEKIISVTLGGHHSSALTSSGRLFMWGSNEYGQLGNNTTAHQTIPINITSHFSLLAGEKITQVSLGNGHSSALTSSGRLFMWGINFSGQLGDGTTSSKLTPTDITSHFSLLAGEKISHVALGLSHTSVITSHGRILMWGDNSDSQLGDQTNTNRLIPTDITSRFSLLEGEKINQISMAMSHSSALTSTGRIFTWGTNTYGRLGDGTTTMRRIPTEITNQFQLLAEEKIIRISIGYDHSSAITSTGRVFMWGRNYSGQLGDSTTINRHIPTEITSNFSLIRGETILLISQGFEGSSAMTSNGRVFTWGINDTGQLGDSTTVGKSYPVPLVDYLFETIHTQVYDFNESMTMYLPVLEGYTFDGWYSSRSLRNSYTYMTMPAQNIKLYGTWHKD